jgi:hypothetical protein
MDKWNSGPKQSTFDSGMTDVRRLPRAEEFQVLLNHKLIKDYIVKPNLFCFINRYWKKSDPNCRLLDIARDYFLMMHMVII